MDKHLRYADIAFLTEAVLNYGNEKSVRKLFDLVGIY